LRRRGALEILLSPALDYASRMVPFDGASKSVEAYLGRLLARPSFRRVFEEAQPYFHMFPG
jgi:glutathione S-transferase